MHLLPGRRAKGCHKLLELQGQRHDEQHLEGLGVHVAQVDHVHAEYCMVAAVWAFPRFVGQVQSRVARPFTPILHSKRLGQALTEIVEAGEGVDLVVLVVPVHSVA